MILCEFKINGISYVTVRLKTQRMLCLKVSGNMWSVNAAE